MVQTNHRRLGSLLVPDGAQTFPLLSSEQIQSLVRNINLHSHKNFLLPRPPNIIQVAG